jgi:hypothetical protein
MHCIGPEEFSTSSYYLFLKIFLSECHFVYVLVLFRAYTFIKLPEQNITLSSPKFSSVKLELKFLELMKF